MIGHTKESHRATRQLQAGNHTSLHHPDEKIKQLMKYQDLFAGGKVLEVFGGQGNLTDYYKDICKVTALDKQTTGDSFHYIYNLRASRKKYKLIDIDSYGYPDKMFPLVFQMLEDDAYIVFTFPIVGVNAVNGIVEQHFINYWRSMRPTVGDVVGVLTDQALQEWRIFSLIDVQKIDRIWRMFARIQRVKATELTGTRNNAATAAKDYAAIKGQTGLF